MAELGIFKYPEKTFLFGKLMHMLMEVVLHRKIQERYFKYQYESVDISNSVTVS